MVDHGLDGLAHRHLVVEHNQLLVVGQHVANLVILKELTDVGLHPLDLLTLLQDLNLLRIGLLLAFVLSVGVTEGRSVLSVVAGGHIAVNVGGSKPPLG